MAAAPTISSVDSRVMTCCLYNRRAQHSNLKCVFYIFLVSYSYWVSLRIRINILPINRWELKLWLLLPAYSESAKFQRNAVSVPPPTLATEICKAGIKMKFVKQRVVSKSVKRGQLLFYHLLNSVAKSGLFFARFQNAQGHLQKNSSQLFAENSMSWRQLKMLRKNSRNFQGYSIKIWPFKLSYS